LHLVANLFQLKIKTMDFSKHIEINPKRMTGKPVIKGTRITVELILEKLSAGESIQDLLEAHPRLRKEDISAALAFAAKMLKSEMIYPLAI